MQQRKPIAYLGACLSWLFTLTALAAPTASLQVSPSSGQAPLNVTMDGSASTGGLIAYSFDYGNFDGSYIETDSTTYTYTTPGEYTVVLAVVDAQGNLAFDHQTVSVHDTDSGGGEQTLQAVLTTNVTSGSAPLTVQFDASTSSGPIRYYSFDYGDFDGVFIEDPETTHTYSDPGTYLVTLAVLDAVGDASYSVQSILVDDFESNPNDGRNLWVDHESLGGACSDIRSRLVVSETTPWCTLAPAGRLAQAGDVVTVRGGIYDEVQTCPECFDFAVLEVRNSGTAAEPVRFLAAPGERVILDGRNGAKNGVLISGLNPDLTPKNIPPRFIEIRGFEARGFQRQADEIANCVFVGDTTDILLSRLDVYDCSSSAVELHRTDRVTLEYSDVHDNSLDGWTSAVDLYECGVDNVVRGNRIWNNIDTDFRETEGHGIIMDLCPRGSSALIENNAIWNNEGWCISALRSDGMSLRHNSCYQNGNGRADTGEVIALGEHLAIHNNVLVPRAGRTGLFVREDSGYPIDITLTRVDGNLIYAPDFPLAVGWSTGLFATVQEYGQIQPFGWGSELLGDDPRYVDPANGDLRVSAGSPAIDSALPGNTATTDLDGSLRPTDGNGDGSAISDRGAYEFGATP